MAIERSLPGIALFAWRRTPHLRRRNLRLPRAEVEVKEAAEKKKPTILQRLAGSETVSLELAAPSLDTRARAASVEAKAEYVADHHAGIRLLGCVLKNSSGGQARNPRAFCLQRDLLIYSRTPGFFNGRDGEVIADKTKGVEAHRYVINSGVWVELSDVSQLELSVHCRRKGPCTTRGIVHD